MDNNIQVPVYFQCPISLEMMKDPVTTLTGITYDRVNIEQWLLFNTKNPTCPVTKQALPRDFDLTPNHTLRRLIQSWCTDNGIDRISTPKPPLNKAHALKLVKNLVLDPHLQLKALSQLEFYAMDNEQNRKCMSEAGVEKAVVMYMIIKCYLKRQILGLGQALNILMHLLDVPNRKKDEIFKGITLDEKNIMIEALSWVLGSDDGEFDNKFSMKLHSMLLLTKIHKFTSYNVMERLNPKFFKGVVDLLTSKNRVSRQDINSVLHVLSESYTCSRNRALMIEANTIFELIELELDQVHEKRTTELILRILFNLCSSADGREQLLGHAGGLSIVSKRILTVSSVATDRAVLILSLISRFSGNNKLVLEEMLQVGAVSKLCMVIQDEFCSTFLKDRAREILESHLGFWKKSPCVDIRLFTKFGK